MNATYAVNPGPGAAMYIEDLKQKDFGTIEDAIQYYQRHGWKVISQKNGFAKLGLFLDHSNEPFSDLYTGLADVDIVIGPDSLALYRPW